MALDGALIVQSDKTLLLEVDHERSADARRAIAPFAELERAPEHIHTYRVTPLGLWNARAAGHDAEQVVNALLTHSRYPVPQALLVDIAERALSPGINDPTTAVQVLDELHRVLRLTVTRADLPAVVTQDGAVRLVHRPQRVEQLVDLALTEPLHYGRDARQVPRRVVSMVEDLLTASLPAHRPHLRTWLERAEASVGRADEESPW